MSNKTTTLRRVKQTDYLRFLGFSAGGIYVTATCQALGFIPDYAALQPLEIFLKSLEFMAFAL